MKRYIILSALCLLLSLSAHAQFATQRAIEMGHGASVQGKALMVQMTTEGLLAKQYSVIKGNEEDIYDFQMELSDYLDKFNDVLQLCACFYAIYYQVNAARHNLAEVSQSIRLCPTGVFAASFKKTRHNVMIATGKNIYEMATSITKLFTEKMSQFERIQELNHLEDLLATFNKQLRALAEQIRYTSLVDLWNEYMGNFMRPSAVDHGMTALKCMRNTSFRLKERFLVWKFGSYEGLHLLKDN